LQHPAKLRPRRVQSIDEIQNHRHRFFVDSQIATKFNNEPQSREIHIVKEHLSPATGRTNPARSIHNVRSATATPTSDAALSSELVIPSLMKSGRHNRVRPNS